MSRPSADLAQRVLGELRRLADAERRLAAHSTARHDGLTPADPSSGEQWDAGQVWAHLAEFGSYWMVELDRLVDAPSDDPVPFGRTKADPQRIAEIERGRHESPTAHFASVQGQMCRLAHRLAGLSARQWTRRGIHPTLGEMDVFRFLDHFLIGHYHEHAVQLDLLTSEPR